MKFKKPSMIKNHVKFFLFSFLLIMTIFPLCWADDVCNYNELKTTLTKPTTNAVARIMENIEFTDDTFLYTYNHIKFNSTIINGLDYTFDLKDNSGLYIGQQITINDEYVSISDLTIKNSGTKAFIFAALAIHKESSSSIDIENLTLENIISRYGAVDFFINNSTITFAKKITFQNNTSTTDDSGGGGVISGGPAETKKGYIKQDGTFNLINNNSKNYGGGIIFKQNIYASFLGNVNISSNVAVNGGGFYSVNNVKLNFYNEVNLIRNTVAYGNGGGFYAGSNSDINFYSKVNFINNTAWSGGAIYSLAESNGNSNINFSDIIKFSDNKAEMFGGAIYAAANSNINFTDFASVIFENNSAGRTGGAINASSNSIISFNNLNNTSFISNVTDNGNGGAIYLGSGSSSQKASIVFKGEVNFTSNSAKIVTNEDVGYGGAIYAGSYSDVNFEGNSIFTGNEAQYGGAGYSLANSTITFNKAEFVSNKANVSGGAVYASADGNISFSDSVSFRDNFAAEYGGAVYADSNNNVKFIKQTYFEGNTAANKGGAIYSNSSSLFLFEAIFNLNKTSTDTAAGGAVYAANGSTITFSGGAVFTENESISGGAVYAHGGSYFIFDDIAEFSLNESKAGGAVYSNETSKINFGKYVNFSSNNASENGGAVYLEGGSLTIDGYAEFKDNVAVSRGGAVFMRGTANNTAKLTINQTDNNPTIFKNNKAGSRDESIYLDGYTQVNFNIDKNKFVYLEDGLFSSGDSNEIIKSGLGTFLLKGTIGGDADLFVRQGTFGVDKSGNLSGGTINLNIEADGIFDLQNESIDTVVIKDFNSFGTLKMDVLQTGSDKIVTETASISGGTFDVFVGIGEYDKKFLIIDSTNVISGEFANIKGNYGAGISLTPEYDDTFSKLYLYVLGKRDSKFINLTGLSYNQKSAALSLDWFSENPSEISQIQKDAVDEILKKGDVEQKETLSQLAGYFLANVMRSQAASNDRKTVYRTIEDRSVKENGKSDETWIKVAGVQQKYGSDENSIGDFEDTAFGISFGWDRYEKERKFIYGIFGKYNKHDIGQEKNSADVNSFGIGAYGGLIKEKIEFKTALSVSVQNYETNRYIPFKDLTAKGSFGGNVINIDGEFAYKLPISKKTSLKPFTGIEFGYINNDEFVESGAGIYNLKVNNAEYMMGIWRTGVGVSGKVGETHKLGWSADMEFGYMFAGNAAEIDTYIMGSKYKANIKGAETGSTLLSLNLGADYKLMDNVKIYSELRYSSASSFKNYYASVGINYDFGGSSESEEIEIYQAKQTVASAMNQSSEEKQIEKERLKEIEKRAAYALKVRAAERKAAEKSERERVKREAEIVKEAERFRAQNGYGPSNQMAVALSGPSKEMLKKQELKKKEEFREQKRYEKEIQIEKERLMREDSQRKTEIKKAIEKLESSLKDEYDKLQIAQTEADIAAYEIQAARDIESRKAMQKIFETKKIQSSEHKNTIAKIRRNIEDLEKREEKINKTYEKAAEAAVAERKKIEQSQKAKPYYEGFSEGFEYEEESAVLAALAVQTEEQQRQLEVLRVKIAAEQQARFEAAKKQHSSAAKLQEQDFGYNAVTKNFYSEDVSVEEELKLRKKEALVEKKEEEKLRKEKNKAELAEKKRAEKLRKQLEKAELMAKKKQDDLKRKNAKTDKVLVSKGGRPEKKDYTYEQRLKKEKERIAAEDASRKKAVNKKRRELENMLKVEREKLQNVRRDAELAAFEVEMSPNETAKKEAERISHQKNVELITQQRLASRAQKALYDLDKEEEKILKMQEEEAVSVLALRMQSERTPDKADKELKVWQDAKKAAEKEKLKKETKETAEKRKVQTEKLLAIQQTKQQVEQEEKVRLAAEQKAVKEAEKQKILAEKKAAEEKAKAEQIAKKQAEALAAAKLAEEQRLKAEAEKQAARDLKAKR
ncbi:MAG: autotransporter domain-containing protein, partial [Endomicrobium sp.]|nr:autotransporter domain-containing protein [Endomicrobium sp.]